MSPIRKGDGTPLEIPGVQEVRSGDGRVFFEGDAIPDSVVSNMDLLYWMEEGSGESISDYFEEVDATLVGEWDTDIESPTYKDEITTYDGDDNNVSSNQDFWIGQEKVSVGLWFKTPGSIDGAHILNAAPGPSDVADDGWVLTVEDDDTMRVFHRNSGGTNGVFTGLPYTPDEWQFVALSIDGDNVDAYLYDATEQTATESGSGSRGLTDQRLNGMKGWDGAVEGDVAVVMAAKDVIPESTWNDIHQDTRP